jgi:hypothetical protein
MYSLTRYQVGYVQAYICIAMVIISLARIAENELNVFKNIHAHHCRSLFGVAIRGFAAANARRLIRQETLLLLEIEDRSVRARLHEGTPRRAQEELGAIEWERRRITHCTASWEGRKVASRARRS